MVCIPHQNVWNFILTDDGILEDELNRILDKLGVPAAGSFTEKKKRLTVFLGLIRDRHHPYLHWFAAS